MATSATAQRTLTFRVAKTVEPASELVSRMASAGVVDVAPTGFSVGVLCSWLSRAGFKLQNERMYGSRLTIVSFEYKLNAFVELLGTHKMYDPHPKYKQMLRYLYRQRATVGDRLYVGWLRVRTEDGDTIKLPDMKFLKVS